LKTPNLSPISFLDLPSPTSPLSPLFRLLILGDLHFEENEVADLEYFRKQLLLLKPHALLSLGDLGGYSHPGSKKSFAEGKGYFDSFGIPALTLLGNHDLEGSEFLSDQANITAWLEVFGYKKPYNEVFWGPLRLLTLSTETFRSNSGSAHEVHLSQEQIEWFKEKILQPHLGLTLVASHAPILGSGLPVLQNLHLKVPNAWLNHTHNPGQFFEILKLSPQPIIWFSAHNHMSQNTDKALTQKMGHTFVHTSVMASISRDGYRGSRILDVFSDHASLLSMDHLNAEVKEVMTFPLNSTVHSEKSISSHFIPKKNPDLLRLNAILKNFQKSFDGDIDKHFSAEEWVQKKELSHKYIYPLACPKPTAQNTLGSSVLGLSHSALVEWDLHTLDPLGVIADPCLDFELRGKRVALTLDMNSKQKVFISAQENGRLGKIYYPNPFLLR